MQYKTRLRGKKSPQFRGYEEMNSFYFSNAQRRALKMGWEFDLDMKFLWELYLKQNKRCALSGENINFSVRTKNRKYGTISLDRIDSKKGYTKDNVQWVHKDINNIKMEFPQLDFFKWCKKVVEYNHL